MNNNKINTIELDKTTLELKNIKSYLFQILFIGLAVLLPTIAHLTGAPVKYLLPMHWTVILAGLVYGWRGGAISGFLSPIVSFMITGMPPAYSLFPIVIELTAYGFIAGWLRENFKLNAFLSVLIALLIGRLLLIAAVFSIGSITGGFSSYFQVSILQGFIAGAAQIFILPFAAKWWVEKEKNAD